MKRISVFAAVLAAGLLSASSAHAQLVPQQEWMNQPVKNLKVLPADKMKTNASVLGAMVEWRDALGVECVHCHVYVEPFNAKNDEASDEKPAKEKTRAMVRMLEQINAAVSTQIPALDKPQTGRKAETVRCITCHRGVPIPRQLVDILTDTASVKGAPAAVAQYRTLRETNLGSYDFGDATLAVMAQRANGANKPDDALLYVQTNLEFHPKSARTYSQMSTAYQKKMDMPNAVAAMEKAVSLSPEDPLLKGALSRLKNPPPPK
jgi:hypothetical protein